MNTFESFFIYLVTSNRDFLNSATHNPLGAESWLPRLQIWGLQGDEETSPSKETSHGITCRQRMQVKSYNLVGGWGFYPIPKNDGVSNSWDDDSSQYHGKVI